MEVKDGEGEEEEKDDDEEAPAWSFIEKAHEKSLSKRIENAF